MYVVVGDNVLIMETMLVVPLVGWYCSISAGRVNLIQPLGAADVAACASVCSHCELVCCVIA